METKQTPIQKACEIVGSQANMARILGVSPSVVNQWVKEIRPVPAEYCMPIVTATKNVVTCFDLLPNDWQKFWPELAQAQTNKAQAATETVAIAATAMPSSAYEKRPEYVKDMDAGLVADDRKNDGRRAGDRKA